MSDETRVVWEGMAVVVGLLGEDAVKEGLMKTTGVYFVHLVTSHLPDAGLRALFSLFPLGRAEKDEQTRRLPIGPQVLHGPPHLFGLGLLGKGRFAKLSGSGVCLDQG